MRLLHLRPAIVTSTEISISLGLLKSIRAPIDAVSTVRPGSGSIAKAPEILQTCLLQPPNVLIEFARPVTANYLYGGARSVTAVAAYVDAPGEFIAAIQSRLSARSRGTDGPG